jgi:two-component system sensor histidine kinase CpxA
MKALGLYHKILLSFFVMLFLVQAFMIGSFILFKEKPPPEADEKRFKALALLAGNFAENNLNQNRAEKRNAKAISEMLAQLSQITRGKAWLTGQDIPEKLYHTDPPPSLPLDTNPGWRHLKGFSIWHVNPEKLIISIPLKTAPRPKAILLLESKHHRRLPPPHKPFLIRLALICLLLAILAVPVSRFIARPINKLRRSALMIADGDLGHRATIQTKDQIGELAHALNHMTDQLEKMITAGRELLAYVSHELRSPLARIGVAGQMLEDALDKGEIQNSQRYLKSIKEEIQQMEELLAGILLLSRLDQQQAPFKKKPLELGHMLDELLAKYDTFLRARNLKLISDITISAPMLGDEDAITSFVSNLLDNAVKHSEPGGVVRVSLKHKSPLLILSIRNPAQKLSVDELERIFEPFFRGANTAQPGSGLGLALARRILEKHGGSLQASWEKGEFVVTAELPGLMN